MKELSLHILDIVQNSIKAKASLISVIITESTADDKMEILIRDNGSGMSEEMAKSVQDPFVTSRTTRKVGLGIPLFKLAAERCDGEFKITSELGKGTDVYASFTLSHIDRQPLGDIKGTVLSLITSYEEIDFYYSHKSNGKLFEVDTREIKKILGEVSLSENDVYIWLSEYLAEGEASLL